MNFAKISIILKKKILIFSLLLLPLYLFSCTNDTSDTKDKESVNPIRSSYFEWLNVEGGNDTKCGYNASPFTYFVNYSDISDNLVVYFEPGGACWTNDRCEPSCDGRCAVHLDGYDETLIDLWGSIATYFFKRDLDDNPFANWNFIFVPYCTADIFFGNTVAEYTDSISGENFNVHHNGFNNTAAVIDFINNEFPKIDNIVLTGSSAGGYGSTLNYHRFRDSLKQIDKCYLIADSGPVFSTDPDLTGSEMSDIVSTFYQDVFSVWEMDPFINEMNSQGLSDDYGKIYEWLADRYPEDRFASVFFKRDYMISRTIIERYVTDHDKENYHRLFADGIDGLTEIFDSRENLGYYIPYYRKLNDSHCLSIITSDGTEIEESNITFPEWMKQMISGDENWKSYIESPTGEDI